MINYTDGNNAFKIKKEDLKIFYYLMKLIPAPESKLYHEIIQKSDNKVLDEV